MYKVVIKDGEIIGTPRQDFISDEDVIAGLEGVTASDIQLVVDEPYYDITTQRFELYDKEKIEQQNKQKEAERINELFMTRSDFFDATIKAFGADEDDLLTAIGSVVVPMSIDTTAQKIALNNYKNALNFYRKHPLFAMLSNVPIKITEELIITITPEQWDKFFDETDKKNPDAYKELLPKEEGGDDVGQVVE